MVTTSSINTSPGQQTLCLQKSRPRDPRPSEGVRTGRWEGLTQHRLLQALVTSCPDPDLLPPSHRDHRLIQGTSPPQSPPYSAIRKVPCAGGRHAGRLQDQDVASGERYGAQDTHVAERTASASCPLRHPYLISHNSGNSKPEPGRWPWYSVWPICCHLITCADLCVLACIW